MKIQTIGKYIGKSTINYNQRRFSKDKSNLANELRTGLPPCESHMGVSQNRATPSYHTFIDGIFPYKPNILGYPQDYGNLHMFSQFSQL